MIKQYDAIISGCGPVGGIAACFLADQGLKVAVVEQNLHVYPYPRAINLDFFSMTFLKKLLGEQFQEIKFSLWEEAGYFLDKHKLDEPFGFLSVENKGDIGIGNFFYQPELETAIRNKIKTQANIEIFYNHTTLKVYQEEELAHITTQDRANEEMQQLAAKFLLGCDGGGSLIRKQIGTGLSSLGNTVLFLIVDTIVPYEKLKLNGRKEGYKVCGFQIADKHRPTTFLPTKVDDRCRWEFRLNADDDIAAIQSPDKIYELLSGFAEKEDITLVRHTVYKFNSLIATKWRKHNIFLCGDAAHQTSPFLGQGLNMGVRNTANLCQKIALVHHGQAEESVLDTYQSQCYEPTKGLIKEALFMGRMFFDTSWYLNLLRSTILFLRKKKPIDIIDSFLPAVLNYPTSNAVKSVRTAYGKIELELSDNIPNQLLFFDVLSYRIFCKDAKNVAALSDLLNIPALVRPKVYIFGEMPSADKEGYSTIKSSTPKMVKKLFSGINYVVMGQNNNIIGTYKLGQETELAAGYKDHFNLKT